MCFWQVFSDEEGGDEAGSEVEEDMEAPMPPQNFTAPSATVNGSAHPPEPEPTPPTVPQAQTPVAPQVPTPVPVRILLFKMPTLEVCNPPHYRLS